MDLSVTVEAHGQVIARFEHLWQADLFAKVLSEDRVAYSSNGEATSYIVRMDGVSMKLSEWVNGVNLIGMGDK